MILDEAAMTADRDLHRVIAHTEAAGAKLVLVGDPRQLSSIGPGGALASLLERHPAILTTLDRNVRQRDPAERRALRQLRNGDVHEAIDWYLTRGRTALSPNRTETLIGMVEGWTRDVADGHDTALLAWRRDDVRDLNRLARNHMHQSGRLSGPHLVAPGGRAYAAGDQAVVLAPLPDQGLVTSQRLTITRTHPNEDALEARTTDGRRVLLTGPSIDSEHLDHGYALTVHRAQGATYDRAHVLANGGGRELAYVALSRARTATTLHAIADDLPQLQHDLALDWNNDQHQRWITDAATPAPPTKADLHRQLAALNEDLRHLYAGLGRWEHTPEGQAARHLNDVRREHDAARYRANALHTTRRDRRAASHVIDRLSPELASAQAKWDAIGRPIADDLCGTVATVEQDLEKIEVDVLRRQLPSVVHSPRLAPPELQVTRGLEL